MDATDVHKGTSAPTRRHWWRTVSFHRAAPTSRAPGPAEDEDAEDTRSPGAARPKWVDNQTAHRVNR